MWLKYHAFTAVLLLCCTSIFAQSDAHRKYIKKYEEIAIREMANSGVPASIKIAQGILESNAGRSDLAKKANNHFGMKISGNWYGKRYAKVDDETDEFGRPIPSYFRVYQSAEESYADHSLFLKKDRYAKLFKLKTTDYKGWAKGLQSAGYATSRTYAKKLIGLIERYKLYELDRKKPAPAIVKREETPIKEEVPDKKKAEADASIDIDALIEKEREDNPNAKPISVTSEAPFDEQVSTGVKMKNDVKYIIAGGNESLEEIAKKMKYSMVALLAYNEHLYDPKQKLNPGTLVFIQAKRKHYRGKAVFHIVGTGENMMDISNLYAVKLDELLKRNRLVYNEEPAIGAQIKLRGGLAENKPPLAKQNPKIIGTLVIDSLQRGREGDISPRMKDPFGASTTAPAKKDTIPNRDGALINNPVKKAPIPLDKLDLSDNNIKVYVVKTGDNLYRISKRYATTVAEIKTLNQLQSDLIHEGMELWIK